MLPAISLKCEYINVVLFQLARQHPRETKEFKTWSLNDQCYFPYSYSSSLALKDPALKMGSYLCGYVSSELYNQCIFSELSRRKKVFKLGLY